MSNISLRPSRWLIYGSICYSMNLWLGPYTFKTYDKDGLYYFMLCWLLFWLGLFIPEKTIRTNRHFKKDQFFLSINSEKFLCIVMFFIIAAGLASIYYIAFLSGVSYSEGIAGVRHMISRGESIGFEKYSSWWSRLVQFISYGSPSVFIIVGLCLKTRYKITALLSYLCLCIPAILVLIQGGRGPALFVISILIFVGIIRIHKNLSFLPYLPMIRNLIFFSICGVVYISVNLFLWRSGSTSSDELMESIQYISLLGGGYSEIKPSFLSLNVMLNGILSPIYLLSWYLSHSIPFFTNLFSDSSYSLLYYGAYHLRVVGYVVKFLGLPWPDYLDIVNSQPYWGMYPSAVQAFLLDFGVVAAPICIFGVGLIFGYIYRQAMCGRILAQFILPIIILETALFPIYPIFWGGSDFVLLELVLVYFLLMIGGGFKSLKMKVYQGCS
ncbi:MAG: O-antigen polymerase [Candidatus Cloacimonadia bacterium]